MGGWVLLFIECSRLMTAGVRDQEQGESRVGKLSNLELVILLHTCLVALWFLGIEVAM